MPLFPPLSLHLKETFTFGDVPTSPKFIGTMGSDLLIQKVVLAITIPFNRPVLLEVGRIGAPAELMVATDNNPGRVGSYSVDLDLRYSVDTDLYLTLIAPGLPPGAGAGSVFIYLD